MLYRAHITVDADLAGEPAWNAFCGRIGMKPLKLMLSTGEHPLHVSCTARSEFKAGPILAHRWAGELELAVAQAGFTVLRAKLAMPLHEAETVTAAYYEAHSTVRLTAYEARDIPRLCRAEGFSHSHSLSSPEEHGRRKHYLTDRVQGATWHEAMDHFNLKAIRLMRWHPWAMLKSEAVLLDSNPELDRGWVG